MLGAAALEGAEHVDAGALHLPEPGGGVAAGDGGLRGAEGGGVGIAACSTFGDAAGVRAGLAARNAVCVEWGVGVVDAVCPQYVSQSSVLLCNGVSFMHRARKRLS